MADISGAFSGTVARVYVSTTAPTALTGAAFETFTGASSTNRLNNIETIGDLTAEGNLIEFSQLGEDFSSSLVGQRSPGSLDVTVTYRPDDSTHRELRDANTNTTYHVVVEFFQSDDDGTYFYTQGRVLTNTVTGISADSQVQMNVSFARIGGPTWAAKA